MFSEVLIRSGVLLNPEEFGISCKSESNFVVNRFFNLCGSLKVFNLSFHTLD